jgi:23S rRNA pseudouridine1911/1915/1917 synthase
MSDTQAIYSWVVQSNDHELRMDRYIAKQLHFYSRNYITDLIRSGRVKKNGVVNNKPSTPVHVDDTLILSCPAERSIPNEQIEIMGSDIQIIFEHPDFLIINKPAGLLVHPPHLRSTEPTLVDWLLIRGYVVKNGKDEIRSGIIHRLDKNTSGIMIIVRTQRATAHFGHLFQERLLHKSYYAIVHGITPKSGTIDTPIIRDPITRIRMITAAENQLINNANYNVKIRHAVTNFFTLNNNVDTNNFANRSNVDTANTNKSLSLIKAEPITGRTHQIRVHLASIGHPLIGDHIYNTTKNNFASTNAKRHMLHAHSIKFIFDAQEYEFFAPLPIDFALLLKENFEETTLHY